MPPVFPRAAFIINFAEWCSVFAIYLVSFAVISRLVPEQEIGRFGLAAAVYGILVILGRFGADRYLIQVRDLRPNCVAAAFGISFAMSLLGSALVLVAAIPVAAMYGDMRLAPVLRIIAMALLATPLLGVAQGLLQRSMQFGRLYAVNTGATVAGAVASVGLAWAGWGAVALASGLVVEALVGTLIALACCLGQGIVTGTPRGIWPGRAVWRDAAVFGGSALGVNLLAVIGGGLPALLAGRMLSIDAVGLLNRAQRMVQLLQDAVQKSAKAVALPALAAGQRSLADLRPPYLMKISYLSGFAWPAFMTIAVTADPIVRVILGPRWTAAIPILRILALGGLFLPFSAMNISIFTVLERLGTMARLQVWLLPVRFVILVAGCWQGSLTVLAVALVAVQGLSAIIISHILSRLLHLPAGRNWAVAVPSLLPMAAAAAIALIVVQLMTAAFGHPVDALGNLGLLALAWPAAGAGWLAAITLSGHPLNHELRTLCAWPRAAVTGNQPRPAQWSAVRSANPPIEPTLAKEMPAMSIVGNPTEAGNTRSACGGAVVERYRIKPHSRQAP